MTFYENVEVGPPTKSNQGAPNETVTPLVVPIDTARKDSEVLCHGAVSVHLSVPAIDRCRGGVSAAGQAGRRHRSIAAWPAPSSNGATAARRTAERWSAAKASSVTFTAAVGG